MDNFFKVPSIIQIFIAEMLCVWGLSSFVMAVCNTFKPGTFGDMNLRGVGNWVWFIIGFALFGWSVWQIFAPKLKDDVWQAINIGSWKKHRYNFCSTHPSYIFIDAILLVIYGFFIWYGAGIGFDVKNFYILLVISLVFPALRLFAWYVLGLKINNVQAKEAWKPAAWFFIPTYAVFALIGILGIKGEFDRKNEIANLPVIDEQTFANSKEKFESLKDRTGNETGFIRLRARQTSDGPSLCKNKENIDFASVSADLGTHQEVLIIGAKYSNSGFDELVSKSSNNKDKIIEVIGKLREMPAKSSIESWKNYCGIESLPPAPNGGRWVLEMKQP